MKVAIDPVLRFCSHLLGVTCPQSQLSSPSVSIGSTWSATLEQQMWRTFALVECNTWGMISVHFGIKYASRLWTNFEMLWCTCWGGGTEQTVACYEVSCDSSPLVVYAFCYNRFVFHWFCILRKFKRFGFSADVECMLVTWLKNVCLNWMRLMSVELTSSVRKWNHLLSWQPAVSDRSMSCFWCWFLLCS